MNALDPFLNQIHCADVLEFLNRLPDESINCVVTSPPYFGLRDYGAEGQIGLEPTPAEFVATMVRVFREVRRVLRDDGTVWLNLGDSYSTHAAGKCDNPFSTTGLAGSRTSEVAREVKVNQENYRNSQLPEKNLLGIPWRVAFALQDDGWILRSDIIWSKPNPMPESVEDRPTKAHEYVFLFAKADRYFYDAEAIREPGSTNKPWTKNSNGGVKQDLLGHNVGGQLGKAADSNGRNKRSVWAVATEQNSFAHFATFPQKLIEPMIQAGCPDRVCAICGAPWKRITERTSVREQAESLRPVKTSPKYVALEHGTSTGSGLSVPGNRAKSPIIKTVGFEPACACSQAEIRPGVVLDPFGGAGTTALVARNLGRDYILCDLNPEYVKIAQDRLRMPFESRQVKPEKEDFGPLFGAINE